MSKTAAGMREALEAFKRNATYPVSQSIRKQGYSWRPTDSLDFALEELSSALLAAPDQTAGGAVLSEVDAVAIAASIAHKVLDHFNSTPINEDDEERDDWCVIRDIAKAAIITRLSAPPVLDPVTLEAVADAINRARYTGSSLPEKGLADEDEDAQRYARCLARAAIRAIASGEKALG